MLRGNTLKGMFMRLTQQQRSYAGIGKDNFIQMAERGAPFINSVMPCKVTHIDNEKGELDMVLPYRKSYTGNVLIPCLHGGVVAAFLDHVGGFAAWTSLSDPTKLLATVDLRVDYLKPSPCEDIICEARVVASGQKLIRADMTVWNKARTEKLALGRACYNVYKLPAGKSLADFMPKD